MNSPPHARPTVPATPPRLTLPRASRRFSAFLAATCVALAVALPVFTLYNLCTTSTEAWLARLAGVSPAIASQWGLRIARWQSVLAALVGMVPAVAMAYGLLRARLCLMGFVRGETFSLATMRHLRGFAAGMVVSVIVALLSSVLVSVFIALAASPGQLSSTSSTSSTSITSITWGVSTSQWLTLLFTAIVWQVAHVMTQAAEATESTEGVESSDRDART